MKIAVLAHLKFPIAPPFAGGLERHTHGLVSGLQRRGHDVSLFAASGSDSRLAPVEICAPTGAPTGDHEGDAAIDVAEEAAYGDMMEAVRSGDFDIIHANCLHDRPLRESQGVGAPMLSVLHVPRYEPFAGSLKRAADHLTVVAVSQQLADLWHDTAHRIEIITNGIDLETFSPSPDGSRPGGPPYAFWSGRLSREKGLHLAIDAARLAGIDLAFAGPRVEDDYWRGEIAPRLGPGVRDLGHLGEEKLVAQLRGAQVAIVSPVWEEPFGLVVPEALACGTPVAAFARGAIPDIVDETSGRIAKQDDVEDLARAILEASRLDRAACRRRGEAYGADRMLDGYEALYARMLAGA